MAESFNWKVLFYAPNVLDYMRLVILYVAYQGFLEDGNGAKFSALYLISYGLDAVDGYLARLLDQTSKLGIYLDMIADRISSALLLHLVAQKVQPTLPEFSYFLYFVLFSVELLAHSVVMFQSERGGYHQKQMSSESQIVQLYLGNKIILFGSCAAFEFCMLSLLMDLPMWAFFITLPGFLFRSVANLRRLLDVTVFQAPSEPASKQSKRKKVK